ncbi:MAG TPA: hypothetical protein VK947_00845 [Planococcus sp. (in: firmicutes)]|nr:hypothetical protein [Planococcus sp. (in: firmicutes)]
MRNDFRLQYPLWMMGFVIVFGILAYGVTAIPSGVEVRESETVTSFSVHLGAIETWTIIGSLVLYSLMLGVFLLKLMRHNKENPTQKISSFPIRPPEYLEQDEGMTYITRKAAQKVYTFMTWALPMLALAIMLIPVSRLVIIWSILAVALVQYLIYYLEIRKHLKEETQ